MENKEKFYVDKLLSLLKNSISKLIKDKEKVAIAFSGGVDSSVIARLIKDSYKSCRLTAYVVGTKNCKDFISAEEAAKELNLKLKKIVLDKKEIENCLKILVKILKNFYEKNREKIKSGAYDSEVNPVSVSSDLPLFFVNKYAKEKYIITGLGPDTMLGGFAKYQKLNKKEFFQEVRKETKRLVEFDYLEDLEAAKFFGKEMFSPFLDKKIVDFFIILPYELKIKDKITKYILRKLAIELGLSDETAFRKRRASQYGSGIMKTMKKIAKEKGMRINDYIKNLFNQKNKCHHTF